MFASFLLFHVGPGIQAIYSYGAKPSEESFQEFSEHFYELYEKSNGKCTEKMYTLTAIDNGQPSNEVLTVTEREKKAMLDAVIHLEKMFKAEFPGKGSRKNPIPFVKKLEMLTDILPPVFFSGTRFDKSIEPKSSGSETPQDNL